MSKKKSTATRRAQSQAAAERAAAIRREQERKERRRRVAGDRRRCSSWWRSSRTAPRGLPGHRSDQASTAPQGAVATYAVPAGPSSAPVKVTVYEDFLCPFCGQFEAASRDEPAEAGRRREGAGAATTC